MTKQKHTKPMGIPKQLDSSPNLAAIKLAEMVVQVLDKKCRNGCSPKNYKWDGFQNGNGTEYRYCLTLPKKLHKTTTSYL